MLIDNVYILLMQIKALFLKIMCLNLMVKGSIFYMFTSPSYEKR